MSISKAENRSSKEDPTKLANEPGRTPAKAEGPDDPEVEQAHGVHPTTEPKRTLGKAEGDDQAGKPD